MTEVPGRGEETALRRKQAKLVECSSSPQIPVISPSDPPVLYPFNHRCLRLLRTALRIPDDGVLFPQTVRNPISPQRDRVSIIDWWHNDALGLMYESDSQD
jgi:hypothetical protein